jgi:peptidoglycan/LPS O-acetylase OafA/YrhL
MNSNNLGATDLGLTDAPAVAFDTGYTLPSAAETGARNGWVESLRLFAAFGIVWYHSKVTTAHELAYAGLIVFIVLTAFFQTRRNSPLDAVASARRLLLPWAFWMLVFGAINLLQHQPIVRGPALLGLLYGTSSHLWYLPFAFAVVCAIGLAKKWAAAPAAIALAVLLLTVFLWRERSLLLTPPLPQYIHALPPVLFGIVLAQRGFVWLGIAAGAVFLMALSIDVTGVGAPYTIAAVAVVVALAAGHSRHMPPALLPKLAPLAFGIYLSHPAFLAIGHRAHLPEELTVVMAYLSAGVLTAVIRQTGIGRAITGG